MTDVEAERAAIVAHMRADANGWSGGAYSEGTVYAIKLLAEEIERGDHHPRKETGSE